jgi:ABC-2 type transport system ATP-binding protein
MLQDGGVYPGARPLEILELFASFYENPEDPEDLLRLVGLADARQTTVRRLSGGQRQRLSLALALVGAPSLVFLDEPTAGMDVHARTLTWQLVRDFRARGMTVVLTTHAMDEAEQLCDRIAIIDAGRVIACGTPAELTRESGQLTFSAEPGLATEELAAALGLSVSAVSETSPGRYVVTRAPTPELVAEIAIWLRDRGVTIGELRAGRRSLEEVFLRLTGAERS